MPLSCIALLDTGHAYRLFLVNKETAMEDNWSDKSEKELADFQSKSITF